MHDCGERNRVPPVRGRGGAAVKPDHYCHSWHLRSSKKRRKRGRAIRAGAERARFLEGGRVGRATVQSTAVRPASAGGIPAGGQRASVADAVRHGGGGRCRRAGRRGMSPARRSWRRARHHLGRGLSAGLRGACGRPLPTSGRVPTRRRRLPLVRAVADAASVVGGAPPTPASGGHVGDRRHRCHGRRPRLLYAALPLAHVLPSGAGRAGVALYFRILSFFVQCQTELEASSSRLRTTLLGCAKGVWWFSVFWPRCGRHSLPKLLWTT